MSGFNTRFGTTLGLAALVFFTATSCSREVILPGERLDLRALRQQAEDQAPESETKAIVAKLALPAAVRNANWTHRNGGAGHAIRHPALGRTLTKVWSQNIGTGSSRKRAISSDPVIVGDRVFTLDSASGLRAFSTAGVPLWSRDLTPPHERAGDASGGGVAYGSGVLVATTGHGDVVAVDPATGQEKWRHRMNGAISAAPVVSGNTVIAVSRSNQALGLNIKNGRILWQQNSSGGGAGVIGAGSPAATKKLAVIPYSSGEIVGAVVRDGRRAWSAVVSGGNKLAARAIVGDISGDPVIDDVTVYVANQAGRMASLDRRSGERNWTINEGSYSPVWPVGGSVFIITDSFALKRLDASDGSEIWAVELPDFKAKRDKRKRDAYAYFGPTLAGGQIWVASSDGTLNSYNPTDGSLTGSVKIPGGAASQPAVAGGRLYILSASGQLHAFQ